MTIQSSTTAAEKNFGFSYTDVTKFNAAMNGGSVPNGTKKMLGPISQSKLSYYSNYNNNYLNQSPNKIANGVKKLNAQNNIFSNGTGVQQHTSNSKTSNYSTKNYFQQQHVFRSNSNASELKVYDQNDDIDEYYPQVFLNSNKINKSKLPLPSLPKNGLPQNYGKIVLKQQNVNLNTDFVMKKSPLENHDPNKKTPISVSDNAQMGRKTSESLYNSNGAHGSVLSNYNGKILVPKKKNNTNKPSLFSPELTVGNNNGHPNGYSNGHANGNSNGHTNGNSNGHTNGYSNGHANGYSNGHANGYSNDHSNGNMIDNTEMNPRQRSTSLLNGAIAAKTRVTSSTRLSTNSSNSSSCSSLINNIEETENLYDLNDLLRKYLIKIEKNYSLEKLYTFVKTNFKHNGYKNFTLDSLEAHLAPLSNMGNYDPLNKTPSNRSYSQARKSNNNTSYLIQQYQNSNYDLNGRNVLKKIKPVENLFRNIKIFRSILTIIQKNMLDDLLGIDSTQKNKPLTPIKSITEGSHEQKEATNKIHRPNSKSLNNINQINNFYQNRQNAQSIPNLNNDDLDSKTKVKYIQLLSKYNRKLYDLNENLNVLLNDQTSCDLKLLSADSNLPSKFEYKNGEYVMRLTNDILVKIRYLLSLCESVYKINFKLNGNFNPIKLNKMATENFKSSLDSIYDLDSFKAEQLEMSEEDPKILKQALRKKTKNIQLPKLVQRVDTKTANLKASNSKISNTKDDEVGNERVVFNKVNENMEQSKNQKQPIPSETPQLTANKTYKDQNLVDLQKNINIKKLTKQDSNDSFIQDTDCSSILSDSESTIYYDYINEIYSKTPSASKNQQIVKKVSKLEKQDSFDQTINSDLYKIEDRNKLFEAYQNIRTQIELTNQMIRDLNIYMQTLLQRAERCTKLEEQLHSDKELIKKTEKSLKLYTAEKVSLQTKNSPNSNSKMNELFKTQLEKQLDYLHYRFKLNYQDLNLEQMCAPEIGAAILDTEQKLKTLNSNMKVLNKNLGFVEYELFERPKLTNNSTQSNHHVVFQNDEKSKKMLNQKALPPLHTNTQSITPQNQKIPVAVLNYYK